MKAGSQRLSLPLFGGAGGGFLHHLIHTGLFHTMSLCGWKIINPKQFLIFFVPLCIHFLVASMSAYIIEY